MGKPKTPAPVQPPQPDPPPSKGIVEGTEDKAVGAVRKRQATKNALRAQYLTAPEGSGVQL